MQAQQLHVEHMAQALAPHEHMTSIRLTLVQLTAFAGCVCALPGLMQQPDTAFAHSSCRAS